MWESLKEIFRAPINKLLLLLGAIFVFLAFDLVRYQNGRLDFSLSRHPNYILLMVGLALLGIFALKSCSSKQTSLAARRIDDGFQICFDLNHAIRVVFGDIQDTLADEYSAIVLPANTSFDDECIHDGRSALGSFFLKHFPTEIRRLQKQIRSAAAKSCGQPESSFTVAPSGTTILLDKPFKSNYRIIITAVTNFDPEKGIVADTLSILAAVKQVLKIASLNRISSLTMPVMGTGHGGLDFKTALSLLIMQCMHCIRYEDAHQIREVTIVVYDPNGHKYNAVSAIVESFAKIAKG